VGLPNVIKWEKCYNGKKMSCYYSDDRIVDAENQTETRANFRISIFVRLLDRKSLHRSGDVALSGRVFA
jgi:hypothetical protein